MSASNWARCPRCVAQAVTEHDDLVARLKADYGKVSRDAYEELKRSQVKLRDELNDEWGAYRTLREDYEIYGAQFGVVKVSYSCSCDACGLSFGFHDERPVPVNA